MKIIDLTAEEVNVLVELLDLAIDSRQSVGCSDTPFATMSRIKDKLEGQVDEKI